MKYQVTDKQKRGILMEGRNYGIGFAFAQAKGPLDGDSVALETIMPISPCKDYLNDVVWSEFTGKPCHAWGLDTKKIDLFKVGVGFIAFRICGLGSSTNSSYGNMKKDIAALDTNLGAIQVALNIMEEAMKVDGRTELTKACEYYVARVPMFWCEATYRISLWSLLVRALRNCSDGAKAMEFLAKVSDEDSAMLNYGDKAALPKLQKMLSGTIPIQDLMALDHPHNEGICSFKF